MRGETRLRRGEFLQGIRCPLVVVSVPVRVGGVPVGIFLGGFLCSVMYGVEAGLVFGGAPAGVMLGDFLGLFRCLGLVGL